MVKTEIIEAIVNTMDIATLWRWKSAIDKRIGTNILCTRAST